MRRFRVALGAAVAAAGFMLVPGSATALSWSLSSTGVGRCTDLATNCAGGAGVVYNDEGLDHGFSKDAVSSATHPQRGLAHGSAHGGEGFLAAPVLHADASGAPFADGAYSWVYSQVQGIQSYVWTGEAADISLNAFQGQLEFFNSIAGYGFASAAFGIFDQSLDVGVNEVNPVADYWYNADANYGFAGQCGDQGAIAIAETGRVDAKGDQTATLSPTCGAETFHVETGQTFYLWARLSVFHASDGFTDASHTFRVGLAPDAPDELVQTLSANLQLGPPLNIGTSVPEPGAWALMLLGFSAAGAALRRARRLHA